MATNYNITPKEFNGIDYDTLYFKNTSQQSLLNDNDFATLLGLSTILNPNPNVNVNDALKAVLNSTVYVGEYVGNDGYGVNNPNEIEFSFIPKLVVIALDISHSSFSIQHLGIIPCSSRITVFGGDVETLPTTWTINTSNNTAKVSWYTTSSGTTAPFQQLNSNGLTYHYYAFR